MLSFGKYYDYGQCALDRDGELGEVWISGYSFAHNLEALKKHDIAAVCSGVDLHFEYPKEIAHLKFDLNDCASQDARHVFFPAFKFIEN